MLMDYKSSINYNDALEWCLENYEEFPRRAISGDAGKGISNRIFKNWRWVETPEGEIVLGNCIEPGITKEAFDKRKAEMINA